MRTWPAVPVGHAPAGAHHCRTFAAHDDPPVAPCRSAGSSRRHAPGGCCRRPCSGWVTLGCAHSWEAVELPACRHAGLRWARLRCTIAHAAADTAAHTWDMRDPFAYLT